MPRHRRVVCARVAWCVVMPNSSHTLYPNLTRTRTRTPLHMRAHLLSCILTFPYAYAYMYTTPPTTHARRGETSTFIPKCIYLALATPTSRVCDDLDDVWRWRQKQVGRLVGLVDRSVGRSVGRLVG